MIPPNISIPNDVADTLAQIKASLGDVELRSWVIAYGTARSYLGKPRGERGLVDVLGGNERVLALDPALLYVGTMGETREGALAYQRRIVVPEFFEGDEGVLMPRESTVIIPLASCTERDLADLRASIVQAYTIRALLSFERTRAESPIATATSLDLERMKRGGRIQ